MKTIKEVLMRRDDLTAREADIEVEYAKEELQARIQDPSLGDPFEVCSDLFGLEPDYLEELY